MDCVFESYSLFPFIQLIYFGQSVIVLLYFQQNEIDNLKCDFRAVSHPRLIVVLTPVTEKKNVSYNI